MPKDVKDSLIIIITCLLTFLWSKTPLGSFSLQFSALLFLFFMIAKRFFKKTTLFIPLKAIFFTILILLLVFDTGSLFSPLFFLLYFLLFSLSLLLEPQIALTLSLSLIVIFLIDLKEVESLESLIPLFSLPFITPLAVFFGREHQKLEETEKELDHDEKATLLWLATTFKEHLDNISDLLLNISNNDLNTQQQKDLKAINHNVKRLKTLGEKLKNEVEGRLE